MRWQSTAALAVALVALGAFYYVYEIRLGPEREKAAAARGRLFSADLKDVTELSIRRKDDVVRIKRDGQGWQLLSPVQARGNRGAIEETLTTLLQAKPDREIADNPPAVAEFGLDAPAADVMLTLAGGKELGLSLGSKTPTGVWVYARERSRPAVFVLSEGVLRDATRPAADFRDRTILAFDRKDVTGVEIVTADTTLAVEPDGGRWKLTRPVALQADTDTVNELLDKLATARVKEFVAEAPPSRQPYGLERPVRVTLHTGRDKDRASRSLLVGRVDAGRKGVYAMRSGEASVLLLPEEVGAAIPRNVAVIRNRVVLEVERDKLNWIEIESPRGAVTVVKDNDRWKVAAPEATAADQVEVGAVLLKLRELRALGFLSDDASGIPRYLARPEVKVTLAQDGAPPTTLLLGPSPEKRGGTAVAYAALAGSGPVVLVEGKALTEVGRSFNDLRDHTLVAVTEPKDIKRVRVTSGGQTVVVERSGERDWRMVEPTRGAAKTPKVEDLLYAVRILRWKDIVAADGRDPGRYGLDAPSMEVVIYKEDGSEIATLQVGKREGERAYVRTKAGPAIYAVESRSLGEAPRLPDDFKG